jgi:hypothetical protein
MCLEPQDFSRLPGLSDNIEGLLRCEFEDKRWSQGGLPTYPTRTVTGTLFNSSSTVIKKRGYMAVARKYIIQWYLSRMTIHSSKQVSAGTKEKTRKLTVLHVGEGSQRRQQTRHCWCDPAVARRAPPLMYSSDE